MADQIGAEYGAHEIDVLEGLEPVRKRPGMYIGSTDRVGLHHLIWEIMDNSVDEAMAGHCNLIHMILNPDNSITIKDNGRGIPVAIHPVKKVSAATLVFTVLHAGGKFKEGAYKTSGGLHGVGASVTNALSEWLSVRIVRDGGMHEQHFDRGIERGPLHYVKDMDPTIHGTSVTFKPDALMFGEAIEEGGLEFDANLICQRLQLSAYLNPGLRIQFEDRRIPDGQEPIRKMFYSEHGLVDMINSQLKERGDDAMHEMLSVRDVLVGEVEVSYAFSFTHKFKGQVRSFVNNIWTKEGGTHHQRFLQSLAKVLSDYARTQNKIDFNFMVDDIDESVMGAISIRIKDPKFVGQTKQKLNSADAGRAVAELVTRNFEQFLEENPDIATNLVKKAEASRKARLNAEKARAQVRRESAMNTLGTLPGKLADCQTKNRDESEVFLVEGDSAGGSAKQGRDRHFQAIMPLRGKITNVLKREELAETSEQIHNLKAVLGCWDENGLNLDRLRYGKVIIMTDADVDGAHIATLLLTFIITEAPELIHGGHVYVAVPPLYKVSRNNGETRYYLNDDELEQDFPTEDSLKGWHKQRFKGLGEMNPSQLWETAMDPATRRLMQVQIPTGSMDEVLEVFSILMGDKVEPRRAFLEEQNCFALEEAS